MCLRKVLNKNSFDTAHIGNGEISEGHQVTNTIVKFLVTKQGRGVKVGGRCGYPAYWVGQLGCNNPTLYHG
jgi:hypothetical protein